VQESKVISLGKRADRAPPAMNLGEGKEMSLQEIEPNRFRSREVISGASDGMISARLNKEVFQSSSAYRKRCRGPGELPAPMSESMAGNRRQLVKYKPV
jgi:hypothetical protein